MTIATLTRLTPRDSKAPAIAFRDVHSGVQHTFAGRDPRTLPRRMRQGEELLAQVSGRDWHADRQKAHGIKA